MMIKLPTLSGRFSAPVFQRSMRHIFRWRLLDFLSNATYHLPMAVCVNIVLLQGIERVQVRLIKVKK